MKNADLMVIAVAALGLFLVAQQAGKKTTPNTGTSTTAKSGGGAPGFGNLITRWNGWSYYDSGYVTDQFGSIYYQGDKVADATWGAV